MEKKIAVISANYGGYEAGPLSYEEQSLNCDFIYFTDQIYTPEESNGWIIDNEPYHETYSSPVDNNPNFINSIVYKKNINSYNVYKYYKLAFQNIPRLKDYDVIIWIDGALKIKNKKFVEYFYEKTLEHKFIVPTHTIYKNFNHKI